MAELTTSQSSIQDGSSSFKWLEVFIAPFGFIIVATVLYFIGWIYYFELCFKLNVDIESFNIPLYSILIVPWDSALYCVLYLALSVMIWASIKPLQFFAFWVIVRAPGLVIWFLLGVFRLRKATICLARWIVKHIERAIVFLRINTPAEIASGVLDDKIPVRIFQSALLVVVVGVLIFVAQVKLSQADKDAEKALQRKCRIEVVCEDGNPVNGNLLKIIGDGLIIQPDNAPGELTIIKEGMIKRYTKAIEVRENRPAEHKNTDKGGHL